MQSLNSIRLTSLCLTLAACTTTPKITLIDIVSIYDGDTLKVNLQGSPQILSHNLSIRVMGVDTPEIRGNCPEEKALAIKAREHTKRFLSAGPIELREVRRGKYFRLLAEVYVGDISLADSLVAAGLGRKYELGPRNSWCE